MIPIAFCCIGHHDCIYPEQRLLPFDTNQVFVPEGDIRIVFVLSGKLLEDLPILWLCRRSLYNKFYWYRKLCFGESVEEKAQIFFFAELPKEANFDWRLK